MSSSERRSGNSKVAKDNEASASRGESKREEIQSMEYLKDRSRLSGHLRIKYRAREIALQAIA